MKKTSTRSKRMVAAALGISWNNNRELEGVDSGPEIEIPEIPNEEQDYFAAATSSGILQQCTIGGADNGPEIGIPEITNKDQDDLAAATSSGLLQQCTIDYFYHHDTDTSEDPFGDSDSLVDPVYIPETSTSHYSDSDNSTAAPRTHTQIAYNILQENTTQAQMETNIEHKKKISRKRQRKPESWKRNKERKLRLEGKEHFSQKGNIVRAKAVKEIICKCHYNCRVTFSTAERQKIFQDYLSLDSERERWTFIANCVSQQKPKRRYASHGKNGSNNEASEEAENKTATPRRKYTLVYNLTTSDNTHQVCKQFFLGTLDISGKKVETALKKKKNSAVIEDDKRGKNPAPNRITEDRIDMVRNHIKSMPVMESHYCRSTTKRQYLPAGLSENRLYQDYLEYCKQYDTEPVSSYYYKHIFTTEFNYGFHRPKKDQCDYCAQFKNKNENDKLQAQSDYDLHMIRKAEARDHKKVDKARAKIDNSFCSYTMDMEKILLTPQLQIGQLYYKRKLKTYNFTIYNLANAVAINYKWHETNGTKGASEVATCIWNLLVELNPSVTEVTFYSDTAAGQNRNSILSAMFLRALTILPNLNIINQKFMESGHSDMECDSVHSAIENRGRKIDIFIPDGWYTVARTAKTTSPAYTVKELDYTQFLNFKSYSQKLITNKNKTDDGDTMKWLDVKWIQYRKDAPMQIFFKTQLSQDDFKKISIRRTTRKETVISDEVFKLYTNILPIEQKKLKDLQELCDKGTIPAIYHQFYMKSLVSSNESDKSDNEEKI